MRGPGLGLFGRVSGKRLLKAEFGVVCRLYDASGVMDSLAALEIGGTIVLSRSRFETIFASIAHEADRKQMAVGLAAKANCSVLFSQSDDQCATFTKRQAREAVKSGPRVQTSS